jgi:hypothetical protein
LYVAPGYAHASLCISRSAASSIPHPKLAATRALSPTTAASSLGEVLGLGEVDEDELYNALDWLLGRQPVNRL